MGNVLIRVAPTAACGGMIVRSIGKNHTQLSKAVAFGSFPRHLLALFQLSNRGWVKHRAGCR